ncbi:MAG: lactate racemase domain-containing protein [Candidatus Competibacterales bacterium]
MSSTHPTPPRSSLLGFRNTVTVTLPYESLDPLTIGSCDDPSKVYREEIGVEVPRKNLWAWIKPHEPPAIRDVTAAAAAALERPHSGPRFSQLIGPDKSLCIVIDNQFRPTPAAKLLPALFAAVERVGVKDARVICANGKVFPMSEADTELKIGRANLERMARLNIPFFQNDPRNPKMYVFKGISSRGTPVWLHREVANSDVTITLGQAQANHWGYGGGGKLILPGVVSDETIESNHAAFVMSPKTHYGAMAGPMRADIDEVASLCDLTCTLNSVLDTKGAVCYLNFGAHPDAHREAVRTFNNIYAYRRPHGGPADIALCGVFAPTDHLFFHTGWGCMSADLVLKDGGDMIYCSPSPGVKTAHLGEFPGFALFDLMKPYMPPSPENLERLYRDVHGRKVEMWAGCIWIPIYEVMARKHLTVVTLEENLAMGRDIGIPVATSLQHAFDQALARQGPAAKVVVLPFARYQMPSDAIRMPGRSGLGRETAL